MVELLAGVLPGGAVLDKAAARNWGSLVLALDPAAAGDGNTAAFQVHFLIFLGKFCAPTTQFNSLVKGAWLLKHHSMRPCMHAPDRLHAGLAACAADAATRLSA